MGYLALLRGCCSLTNYQKDLINLLKKSMFKYEFDTSNIDWESVYKEASTQAVSAFVYDSTDNIDNIPECVYKLLKQYTISVMLKNEQIFQGQKSLVKLLEENKIDYAIIKGFTAAVNYTKPELRTLGDVDFLVRKSDFQRVKNLLLQNGYSLVKEEENHFHCALKKDGVLFEMHFELSEFPNTKLGENLRDFLDSALDDVVEYEFQGEKFKGLNIKFQMFSLLLHMERHMSKDGLGLRQLLDFRFFVEKHPEVMQDEEYVLLLKKYGLFKMASVCIDLVDKYFYDKEINNKTVDMLMEMSLKRGNFGVKNSHDESLSNKIIVDRNGANKIAAVRWFKYFKIRSNTTWGLARKHPLLSNVAFVYLPIRYIFRRIFKHKENVSIKNVVLFSESLGELYNNLSVYKSEIN